MNRSTIGAIIAVVVLAIVLVVLGTGEKSDESRILTIPGVKSGEKKAEPPEGESKEKSAEETAKEAALIGPPDRIVITRKGQEATLTREGEEQWRVTGPFNGIAESYKVSGMLRSFDGELKSNYSRKVPAGALAKLGLDEESRIRVTLHQGDSKLVDIFVGRVDQRAEGTGIDPDTIVMLPEELEEPTYFRIPEKDLRRAFDIEFAELRDKKVFDFKKEDITRVEIDDPRGTATRIVMTRKEGGGADDWELVEPKGVEVENLAGFLSSLVNTRADEFLAKLPGADAQALDKAYRVTMTVKQGESETTRILALGAGRKKGVYARIEGADGYFLVPTYTATQLMKSLNDFRKKKVFSFQPEDVEQITIEQPAAERIELSRTGDEWSFVAPAGERAASAKVKSLASAISNFRAAEFLPGQVDDATSGLLAGQALRVAVKLAASAGTGSAAVLVGSEFKNTEGQERFYARLEGQSELFTIMKYSRDNIAKSVDELRDKRLFFIDKEQIVELTLSHPDQTISFVRQEAEGKKSWKMTAPKEKAEVDLTSLLSTLASLDIEGEATNPESAANAIKANGFTISFKLEDQTSHQISFSEEVEDNKNYASSPSVPAYADKLLLISKYKVQNLTKKLPDFDK